MSSLLDDRPGVPAGRPRRRLPRPLGLLIVVGLLLALVGVVAVGGRALYRGFVTSPDYSGNGTGRVVVQIRTGDTATDIGRTLYDDGVVRSVGAFRAAADADPRSRGLAPGYFALRRHMRARSALLLLLDPASRLRGRVTLPEGVSLTRALRLIARGTEIPLDALQAAAANPAGLGLPAYANGRLDGFLFPATYDVEPGSTATEALRMMVERFDEAAAAVDLEGRAAASGHTPYQVLTVASLVEAETAAPDDRSKVAAVIWNRLKAGMRLELDSTVNFALGQSHIRVSTRQTQVGSPYNTYRVTGLPPTPIGDPGQASLEAALSPAPGGYLYFVRASRDGHSFFTPSYQAFLAAKAKAQRDGVY